MKSAGIGDMVLASAVARDLVAARPDCEVVLFAGPDNEGVARLVEGVEVVVLPMTRPWEAVSRLRAARVDVLLDLGQWTRLEALCAFLSGAAFTVGFRTPGQRRHYCYDAAVLHSSEVHELENFRRIAAAIGVESRSLPSIPAPEETRAPVEEPYAVFHLWPGGFRSELKEWPLRSWRELAARLHERGLGIVLTGGPGDAERTAAFAASCAAGGRVASVAGRCSLGELVGILARASCVVSVNTGVMHLAAAVGAPTVGLNGPTSEARWGPLGPRTVSVNSELPGCGYLNLGFEYEGHRTDCMEGIAVDRVTEAVLSFLGDA